MIEKNENVNLKRYQTLELTYEEVISLATAYLADAVNIPDDVVCVEAREDFSRDCFQFKLCSKSYEPVKTGAFAPVIKR